MHTLYVYCEQKLLAFTIFVLPFSLVQFTFTHTLHLKIDSNKCSWSPVLYKIVTIKIVLALIFIARRPAYDSRIVIKLGKRMATFNIKRN